MAESGSRPPDSKTTGASIGQRYCRYRGGAYKLGARKYPSPAGREKTVTKCQSGYAKQNGKYSDSITYQLRTIFTSKPHLHHHLRHHHLAGSLRHNLINTHPRRPFFQPKLPIIDLHISKIGHNLVNTPRAGQGQGALRQQFRCATLAGVVMVTMILSAPATRSMAPPMPFISLRGIIQEAMLPSTSTSNAPSTVRSTWPPRIMAKDSAELKMEAPVMAVTVCLPALIMSASSCSSVGNGPMRAGRFPIAA